ncbi:MAG: hfsH [Caulobacteraceae bacterium]|nr:hfsH [Caulobacteraceae bacterium]
MGQADEMTEEIYHADTSLKGKLRRRLARVLHRRPAGAAPRAMVSFCFDDAPATAAEAGASALEDNNARGTYYLASGMIGHDSHMGPIVDARSIEALASAGHEIGCHTFSHLDCGVSSADKILADVEANRQALTAAGLGAPSSFAYPYGDVSPAAKKALEPRFALLRALHHGLVEDGSDLNQAPAVGIEGQDGEEIAARWLREAKARNAWLILYTHDVQDTPSPFGCTEAALRRLVELAKALDIEIVTVTDGVRRLAH